MMRVGAVVALVGVGLACAGGPSEPVPEVPPTPVPEPAQDEPAQDDEDGGKLPRLPRDDDGPRTDDCTMDMAGMAPMLAARQGEGEVRVRHSANRLVERFTRGDGVEVRVVVSGCTHYGETWEATVPEGRDPRELALAVMGDAELRPDKRPAALDALRKATDVDEEGWFPCGDATCQLTVTDGVVRVAYDFPL